MGDDMEIEITFDKSLGKDILDIFDKTIDDHGTIVEKDVLTQKVLTPEGDTLSLNQFAGITKGSEIFIKSDLISLMDFAKKKF
jgi:hypothetical protein